MAGVEMVHVPYRGAAPAMMNSFPVASISSGGATLDNARSGQVQVLGYTGAKRAAIAPEVPTIAEDGVPDFNVISWYGFFVPANTLRETIMKMNADDRRAGQSERAGPSAAARLREQSRFARAGRALLKSEAELWSRVIKEAGIAPLGANAQQNDCCDAGCCSGQTQ